MSVTALLVLGMHRSGTSALAGALVLLGGRPPANLMQPTVHNERGFWESNVIAALNDEILAANGSAWDDWRKFHPGWYDSPAVGDFRARAAASLAEEFDSATLPVVKDPRICRLVPFWSSVFGEMNWSSHVLLPVRSPLEVARSLQQRDGMSLNHAALLWLRHVLEAEAESRGTPRAVVNWNGMFSDWRRALARAAEQVGIDLPGRADSVCLEVDEFLSTDLWHQRATSEELRLHPAINDWVRAAYAAILMLVEDPAHKGARRALDDIRARFDAAALVFSGLLQEEEQAWRDKLARSERDGEHKVAENDQIWREKVAREEQDWREKFLLSEQDWRHKLAEGDRIWGEQLARKEQDWREKLALGEQDWQHKLAENDRSWHERLVVKETELEEVKKKAAEYADQLDKMNGLLFWRAHALFCSIGQVGARLFRSSGRTWRRSKRRKLETATSLLSVARSVVESATSAKERGRLRSDLSAPPRSSRLREEPRFESYRGVLISLSHDDYAETVGGVQNCVADEEAAFAKQDWVHLHISPALPLPALSEATSAADFLVSARLNGRRLGVATAADLAARLAPARRLQKPCCFVLHHLAGFSTEVVAEFVKTVRPDRSLAWIHDFFTICPSYALLRNDVAFCGAPGEQSKACGICCYGSERPAHLMRIRNLFEELEPELLAPSETALSFWLAHSDLRHARSKVVPHGNLSPALGEKRACMPLRVGFIGTPGYLKGWFVFEKLAADSRTDPRYKFFQLSAQEHHRKNNNIQFHAVKVDRLARDAMIRAVASLRIDVAVLWSLWPETFCFTAHEALAGGAFIVTREGAGNIASIIAGTWPARGCILEDEEELFDLFQSGKICALATSGGTGVFEPISGTAAYLLQETSDA